MQILKHSVLLLILGLLLLALSWFCYMKPVQGDDFEPSLSILDGECWASSKYVRKLTKLVHTTTLSTGVPATVLSGAIVNESRCRPRAIRVNKNGSTDVGLGQINVPNNDPVRIAKLLNSSYNLKESVRLLQRSLDWCATCINHRYCPCPYGRYNPYRARRWCAKLTAVIDRYSPSS